VVLSDNTAALADYFAHSSSIEVLFRNEKFFVLRVKEGVLKLPEFRIENASLENDLAWMSAQHPEEAKKMYQKIVNTYTVGLTMQLAKANEGFEVRSLTTLPDGSLQSCNLL
jgi:hypothetical protein